MSSKILIVDDEKGIVATLEDYFESQGYQVYCAYSGKEALEKSLASQILYCLI